MFQGAKFDLVEALISNHIGFRDEKWVHVNFLAHPRSSPDTAAQHFFAELHYDRSGTPFVETCTILGE
jgi:hypothetical protein